MTKRLASITVDVETDWGGRLSVNRENCVGVEKGIPYLLSLFDSFNIKATFFISAPIAGLYREIIEEINSRGHEVASHGYDHIDYSKITREQLEYYLKESKDLLEKVINQEVIGFRSPQFRAHQQLYESLLKVGYLYDSSIVAGRLIGRYSNKNIPKSPFMNNGILEIPVSNIPMTNKPFGLLWVNHLGFSIFATIAKLTPHPQNLVMYLHPFDLLSTKNRCDFGIHVKFWYRFKKRRAQQTLKMIIEHYRMEFKFIPLKDYLNEKF